MGKGIISGFTDEERLKIKAESLGEASRILGETMKEENRWLLEKNWSSMNEEAKIRILKIANDKVGQLKEWSNDEIYDIGGENRLKSYLEAFEGYCLGSEISLAEGAFLQIEVMPGCQTLFVKDSNDNIGFIHSEEEGDGMFDENHYGYKWVEMELPNKKISFFAYHGLCSWGPAFGINETTNFVQTVDDLYIQDVFDTGVLWATVISFLTLDIGRVDLVEDLVARLNLKEGKKFVGGYAIHMAQVGVGPKMLSIEFAQDTIRTVEIVSYKDRLIVAQANCPLNNEVLKYSQSAYPIENRMWNEDDAELYVEMKNRRQRIFEAGKNESFPGNDAEKTIEEGLKILANPWGDVGRVIDKKTGDMRYYPSGFPSNVMNSHLVGFLNLEGLTYYVGKLTPKPIKGEEYETKITPEYKFGLKKIWEQAREELDEYREVSLKKKYPWLFLNKKLEIDIIYDFIDIEENEREQSAGQDTMDTARELAEALVSLGHKVKLVPIKADKMEEQLDQLRGEVVFNQVEEDILGFKVLEYLEKNNKVVTGVDSTGFELSWDKVIVKEMLIDGGVPTPKYIVCDPETIIIDDDLNYPLFVKAADDHGSLSINEHSLVNNRVELVKQIGWIKSEIGGPALIEEYVEGRELGVTVLGNGEDLLILPTKEILFGKEFENKPKIITYESKWDSKSEDWAGTMNMSCPAILSESENKAIEEAIRKSCEVLKVRDYARFDVRLKDDVPYIIDYNANPAIGSKDASGLPSKVFGFDYPEFIQAIVAVAIKRVENK